MIARARWSFKLLRGYAGRITRGRFSKASSRGWCVVPKKWIKSKNLEHSAQVFAKICKQPRSLECYQACVWPMDNKRWNLQEFFGYVLRRGNKSFFEIWLHDAGETIEPT